MKAEKGKYRRKYVFPPRKWWLSPFLGLCLAGTGPVMAADYADLIRQSATAEVKNYAKRRGWVNYHYEVTPGLPASQDQMPPCTGQVVARRASRQSQIWGRVPYVLSCSSPEWELRAHASVSLVVPVVVAKRNISRGERLDRSVMKLEKRDLARVYRDFVTDIRLLAGQRARRSVRAGQVISLSHAVAPLLVKRGDQVVIRAEGEGIYASTSGEALQDGSRGETIRVRNLSSGKVITAWVVEKGVVETRF